MKEKKPVRVFAVEDDQLLLDLIQMVLQLKSNELVGAAMSAGAAMLAIARFKRMKVDVVTVDVDMYGEELNVEQFIEETRRVAPRVKIIGLAGHKVKGADYDLGKAKTKYLNDVIDEVMGRK
ncbi:MAG: hypothetical protein UX87_C0040G0004 [Candidatus Amesbacteria bacterium GW2011_GWA1_47_16]|uniref:Response regulatory domain-containing protein n=3 Tax=Candidatus Amesiibacteriota TaxID=1752730 RepID=A0A0G1UU42_9BACT|nr:MAG: hypothetical protein UX87_C0040G0004 [Candidatus Amesbacteria bacterium GW2011_GWA1_47_16]KKU97697.1 MAG: hypothetical protein UY28_C0016G0006 [Candidatus Amesbacteria bacterium GW2011_GWB1_48_13]OGD01389.1 MAG: hypothetical protein A2972_04145 [Candidatus Amesbacteria bacterium RIFCSPLOWO2_01_FULL_47_33]